MNNTAENCRCAVLIGFHDKVVTELEKRGIRCVILKNNEEIDCSVRNHADMAAFHLPDGRIILDRRQKEAAKLLKEFGCDYIFTEKEISGAYPDDVMLNAAQVGDTLICNSKYISREILSAYKKIIDVRQGYTKCSVCVIGDNAFITDDSGIYEKCKDSFDVLLTEKGDIVLEGQNYGFIGGASAKVGDKIYFFGSLERHRNGEEIKKFLSSHKAEYECLFEGNLIDIGGLVEI